MVIRAEEAADVPKDPDAAASQPEDGESSKEAESDDSASKSDTESEAGSETDAESEAKNETEKSKFKIPEPFTNSLGCSACEYVSSRIAYFAKTLSPKEKSKPLANRTLAAQQIMNYTCTSFWNYAIFGAHGPAHRRRFIDLNDTSVKPKSLHNLTSGEEYDNYFYSICHHLTTVHAAKMISIIRPFYIDTSRHVLRKRLCVNMAGYCKPPKKPGKPLKAKKTPGEKCLIKAVDAIAKSKWDDAFKHLKCAESKA